MSLNFAEIDRGELGRSRQGVWGFVPIETGRSWVMTAVPAGRSLFKGGSVGFLLRAKHL